MAVLQDNQKHTETDRHFMKIALAMARRGLGTTAPNPSVGALIVDDEGVILGRGWTQPGGRPHAEIVALEKAGNTARGATLYVTLEPCSHHGKSPPCADAVIKAGIRRVVCAFTDPHDLVAGDGLKRLRSAGLETVEGVLLKEAKWITLGNVLAKTQSRPFVQLKMATGADGKIASGTGAPVWVTGEQARSRGHLLRAKADAILVGIGTVMADDPSLDCRLPGLGMCSPAIVVLDRRDRLPSKSKIGRGGRLLKISSDESIAAILKNIANENITRLLVEGGPHVWRSFLEAGLVDEVVMFKGTDDLGGQGLLPFVDRDLDWLEVLGFKEIDRRDVGEDKMIIYRNEE